MRVVSPSLLSLIVLLGCGGGGGGTDASTPDRPACEEIIDHCHELDMGLGEIHECHEYAEAEDTTNDGCLAMQAHCFEVCVAGDAGATTDSGSVDAASDH